MVPACLVTVIIIGKGPVADMGRGMGLFAYVLVAPVVGGLLLGDRDPGGLDHVVGLDLGLDVVDGVVGQGQGVLVGLVRAEAIAPACLGQPVEVVVAEGLGRGAAGMPGSSLAMQHSPARHHRPPNPPGSAAGLSSPALLLPVAVPTVSPSRCSALYLVR